MYTWMVESKNLTWLKISCGFIITSQSMGWSICKYGLGNVSGFDFLVGCWVWHWFISIFWTPSSPAPSTRPCWECEYRSPHNCALHPHSYHCVVCIERMSVSLCLGFIFFLSVWVCVCVCVCVLLCLLVSGAWLQCSCSSLTQESSGCQFLFLFPDSLALQPPPSAMNTYWIIPMFRKLCGL